MAADDQIGAEHRDRVMQQFCGIAWLSHRGPINAYTQPVLLGSTVSNGSSAAVSNQTGPYSWLSTTTKSNGRSMSRISLFALRISGVTVISIGLRDDCGRCDGRPALHPAWLREADGPFNARGHCTADFLGDAGLRRANPLLYRCFPLTCARSQE